MEDFEDDDDEQTEFYFESDHLALRGNADYCNVLRHITILQAQRTQATKELDQIVAAQRAALADPEEFVRKLVQNVPVDVPGPINIAELPKINFTKYNVTIPTYLGPDTLKMTTAAPKTNDLTVRGRVFDQTKPESFNQLWSNAEQRRLEELLIEYPPEPIERRRFAKIAKALGNRTTKQVASRLQKYFKKLHSAGFPIPGRLPKRARQAPNAQKLLKQAVKPTTFFPNQDVPVMMCEGDDDSLGNPLDPSFYQKYWSGSDSSRGQVLRMEVVSRDQEPDRPEALEQKVLRLLKRIRADREIADRPYSEHEGHKCDQCDEEPIVETRWTCTTCSNPVDFCMDCMISQIKDPTSGHPLDHKFVGVRCVPSDGQLPRTSEGSDDDCDVEKSGSFHDTDYLAHKFSKDKDYNYLDPNFLPE